MVKEKTKKRSTKTRDILQLAVWVVILVLLNYVGVFVFERFDLTSEKRYSLSPATKELVSDLDDFVFVRVYLAGDLPAGFKRLQNETKEMLDEFRAYSKGWLEYEFIDPSESPDEKVRMQVYQRLSDQGLQYTNLEFEEGDKRSEKIIFPGAIFTYKGKEVPLQLLKSQMGAHPEVMLNNSIQQLEYEIASSINKITKDKQGTVTFIEGHGELDAIEVADITKELQQFYKVDRVRIDGKLDALKNTDAIIIAKPDSAFSDKDKFIIDQFIMDGGKALWLVDGVFTSMDSLQTTSTTMAVPQSLNLEDMLFIYGARINTNLVMDMQALPIPVVTGYVGNQPKQEFFPWFYFPLLVTDTNRHAIVHNLDAVKTEFASSIDTVGKSVKKTVLLTSSQYTKLVNSPARVSLNVLREAPDESQYTKGEQIVAVLLEDTFKSVFKNRIPPEIQNNKKIGFREKSVVPTKMVVVADGDIIKNPVNKRNQQFYPLGYDKYTDRQYANKDFILNTVNYLCDDSGLIQARSKEIKLRLLDKQKAENEQTKWQTINMALPVILILLFAMGQHFYRRKLYAK